jgi:transcriptional regulator GlxA family with amidase domain
MPENDVVRPLFRYVLSMCMWARQERQAPPPKPSLQLTRAVETLLGALLVGPVRQFDELGRDLPEPVRRAMRFMEETLAQDPGAKVTLGDLAKASAVSGEHLCRLFASALHMTPMEAMRYQRLELAIGLVARSNLNVEQIAYRCGFASPYHFSRVFKQVFSVAPTLMRKRIEAGETPPLTPLVRVLRK